MNVKFKPFLLQFGPGCLAVWRTRGSYLVMIYILPMIAVFLPSSREVICTPKMTGMCKVVIFKIAACCARLLFFKIYFVLLINVSDIIIQWAMHRVFIASI